MNRRELLISATVLTGAVLLPRPAFADKNRIDVYVNADANISDFWSNVIKPAFEKANAGVAVNVVPASGDNGTTSIVARAMAALATKSDPLVDVFEEQDPHEPKGGIEAGLWADFSKAGLTNYSKHVHERRRHAESLGARLRPPASQGGSAHIGSRRRIARTWCS